MTILNLGRIFALALTIVLFNVLASSGVQATGVLCHVDYQIVADRGDSYQVNLHLRNVSGLTFDGFELAWQLPVGSTLKHGWNASFTQDNGRLVVFNPANHWNGRLVPFGGVVTVGFEVNNSRPPALRLTDQTQFFLNGANCEDPVIRPPTSSTSSSSSSSSSASSSGSGTAIPFLMDSNFCLSTTGDFENRVLGYEGEGYVDMRDKALARLDYPGVEFFGGPTPANSSAYYFEIRYANGSDDDLPVAIYAGGIYVDIIAFPPTGGWSVWSVVRVESVTRLRSQLSLVALGTDGGPLIDHAIHFNYVDCGAPGGCGYSAPSAGACPGAPLPGADLRLNAPPIAHISASTLIGHPVLQVAFSAEKSADPDGDSLTYTWDFGDGTLASGRDVQHDFIAIGDYRVTLTVSDGKVSNSESVSVKVVSPPDALRCEPGEIKQWQRGMVVKDIRVVGSLNGSNSGFSADFTFSAPVKLTKHWNMDNAENVDERTVRLTKTSGTDIDFANFNFGFRVSKSQSQTVVLEGCGITVN